jgi:hypothetical protein
MGEITWRMGGFSWPEREQEMVLVTASAEVPHEAGYTQLQSFTVAVPATLQELKSIEREVYRRLRPILEELLRTIPTTDRERSQT